MTSLIVIYPIFFFLLFCFIKEKRDHMLYTGIILMYFFAGLASVYICYTIFSFQILPQFLIAIIYHIVLMFLLLWPLRLYDNRSRMNLDNPNQIVDAFTYFIILITVIYVIDGIRDVSIDAFINDVSELRQVLVEEDFYENKPIIGYVAYISKNLNVAPLALMFYYIVKRPEKKTLITLLFLCSLGTAVVELRVAAREYIIKYLFIAVCLYYGVRNEIPSRRKRTIKFWGLVLSGLIIGLFMIITILRFGTPGDSSSTIDSLLSYYGQGFAYFSQGFMYHPNGLFPDDHGATCFPFFVGHGRSVYNTAEQVSSMAQLNVFRTTIGSWLLDCGIIKTIFITIIFSIIIRFIGKLRYQNAFSLIYMAFVYDFIFSLLFFYNNIITGTKLLIYLLVILLDYSSRHRKYV